MERLPPDPRRCVGARGQGAEVGQIRAIHAARQSMTLCRARMDGTKTKRASRHASASGDVNRGERVGEPGRHRGGRLGHVVGDGCHPPQVPAAWR